MKVENSIFVIVVVVDKLSWKINFTGHHTAAAATFAAIAVSG